jgi:CheY-like chemotaxis protein
LDSGAIAFVAKPIQAREVLDTLLDNLNRFARRREKSILIASTNPEQRDWLVQHLAADDVRILTVPDCAMAATLISENPVDCMVLDANLPSLGGQSDHRVAEEEPALDYLPIIVYGGTGEAKALNGWRTLARSAIVRDIRSPDRLLEQASLFLHRDIAKMPETHRATLRKLHNADAVLQGKRVMIVDDDIRNIFALSSLLEEQGMVVVSHDNGRDAIRNLEAHPDIDIVLMDIMMPEIDGVDTIREIRKIGACKELPIIAVTAKAMKGDREKCMEAGAWDYLSKPVDTELLVGVLRAWLGR